MFYMSVWNLTEQLYAYQMSTGITLILLKTYICHYSFCSMMLLLECLNPIVVYFMAPNTDLFTRL